MKRLNPAKLHVTYLRGAEETQPLCPRRYTLTHSDRTGDLFLAIGTDYDGKRMRHWYTRLMRDEVLGEWEMEEGGPFLLVHCHVSGGTVAGSAGMRYGIFRRELPLALEAIRFGDGPLVVAHAELDAAPVRVSFHAAQPRYDGREEWGRLGDYS